MSLARSCMLALALALLGASPALASSAGEKIILRCTHGESLSGFSQSAYSEALRELSADAEEYTDCASLIRQAQNAAAAGHRGGVSGLGAAPVALAATASELQSIGEAKSAGSGPVSVGGQIVHPGVVHADIASAFSTLPAPLLAVLALLLACVLAAAAVTVRRRVRRHSS